MALSAARASKQSLRIRQTQWLLAAGIQRAQSRIADGKLDNEVWLMPESILADGTGKIQIETEYISPDSLKITVIAEYGPAVPNDFTIRRSFDYRHPIRDTLAIGHDEYFPGSRN